MTSGDISGRDYYALNGPFIIMVLFCAKLTAKNEPTLFNKR